MKTSRFPSLAVALGLSLTALPLSAQTVSRVRRSLDRATGGQTAAPARPAPAGAAVVATSAQAAAIQAAQNKRNQEASVGADQRVIEFLKERIAGGSAEAAVDLAQRHTEGKGVAKDPKEARRLYELAAARGSETAQAWLKENPAPAPVVPVQPVAKPAAKKQP
jgi:TPR repeat protein